MTIEEKAKAYDELKVKAQKLEEDGCFDKITLFDLFPELKESEDESIREAIIKLVDKHPDGTMEMLSWLEKQGEQKPTWNIVDETILTNIIIMLKEGASLHFNKKDITKAVDWLKSLRYRSHWKPSDEQIKVLDEVIRNPHLSTDEYNGLITLKEQLKTQKG